MMKIVFSKYQSDVQVSAWAPMWYLATGLNMIGGISYALFASGNEQPWATRKLNYKYQCQFEINQFLFRETNQDELPILEGEDEVDEENHSEERTNGVEGESNPNYETPKSQE